MSVFYKSAGLGSRVAPENSHPLKNHHTASAFTPELKRKIAALHLERVAGDTLICPSTKEFWAIKDGKLVRVTVQEVDNGDRLELPNPEPQDIFGGIQF